MSIRHLKHLPSVLTAYCLAREVLYERARREFRPLSHAELLAVELVDSSFDCVWNEAERRLANRIGAHPPKSTQGNQMEVAA